LERIGLGLSDGIDTSDATDFLDRGNRTDTWRTSMILDRAAPGSVACGQEGRHGGGSQGGAPGERRRWSVWRAGW